MFNPKSTAITATELATYDAHRAAGLTATDAHAATWPAVRALRALDIIDQDIASEKFLADLLSA